MLCSVIIKNRTAATKDALYRHLVDLLSSELACVASTKREGKTEPERVSALLPSFPPFLALLKPTLFPVSLWEGKGKEKRETLGARMSLSLQGKMIYMACFVSLFGKQKQEGKKVSTLHTTHQVTRKLCKQLV